jgi:hypothetical protein
MKEAHMRRTLLARQQGVTFIGWILLLLPIAVVGYAAIRVAPAYLNYTKVSRAFDAVQKEYAGADAAAASRALIREALGKRFDIDSIYSPKIDEVDITHTAGGWTLAVDYEHEIPLFYNASLLLKFSKTVNVN